VAVAPSEAEVLVGELESRVDRLRSLYDQYFCGLEKLEPAVPKKDVERRIAHLRKINLRNTALRFRFSTAVQRYNTYLSHWQRICRQIEEGTYKRDVRRAQERFGPVTGMRGKRRGDASAIELNDLDFEEDLDMNEFNSPESDSDELDTLRPMEPAARHPPVAIPASPKAPRFPGITAASPAMATPAPQSGSRPKTVPPQLPERAVAQAHLQTQMQEARAAASGDRTQMMPVPPGHPALRAGLNEVSDDPYARQMRREAATGTRPIPLPFAPLTATHAVPRPGPAAGTTTPRPGTTTPRPATIAPRGPLASGIGGNGPIPNIGGGNYGSSGPNLSDDRVRALYKQYVEAKRSRQESTAAITFDGLAQTLRDSSAKLKQKHGDKQVDFEVAVKDGKTILRPVVK
jgi:hypothetical protein